MTAIKAFITADSTRQTVRRVILTIQFVAILLGVPAVLYEFWEKRPIDRAMTQAQLHADLAFLATNERTDDTHRAIQDILSLMHDHGLRMGAISLPEAVFYMAHFDNADWTGAWLKDTHFYCSDQGKQAINDAASGSVPAQPCTAFRDADLPYANLDRARLGYANFSRANFHGASLEEARFDSSFLTDAQLQKADVSAVQLRHVDLSGAHFGRSATFDCKTSKRGTVKRRRPALNLMGVACPRLRDVDFARASMQRASFEGAELKNLNFAGADLFKAEFLCDHKLNTRICSIISSICLDNTNLRRAQFNSVHIENTDFSRANLTKAKFTAVTFNNVRFSKQQLETAIFDNTSLQSRLRDEQRRKTKRPDIEDIPCSLEWRGHLTDWQTPFRARP